MKNVDGLHQGPKGVGAAAVVRDGWNLFFEQQTFVKVRIGLGHVIDLPDDSIHRAVGDDHDPGRVDGHGKVGQKLKKMNKSRKSGI